MGHGIGCRSARGIFLGQGSNPHLLCWQVDSFPLSHQVSRYSYYLINTSIIRVANIHTFSGYYIPGHHCWTREIQINKTWYLPRVIFNAVNLSRFWCVHFYPGSCRSFHHSRYPHPCSSYTDISSWSTPNYWQLKKNILQLLKISTWQSIHESMREKHIIFWLVLQSLFCNHHKIILKPLNSFKK